MYFLKIYPSEKLPRACLWKYLHVHMIFLLEIYITYVGVVWLDIFRMSGTYVDIFRCDTCTHSTLSTVVGCVKKKEKLKNNIMMKSYQIHVNGYHYSTLVFLNKHYKS